MFRLLYRYINYFNFPGLNNGDLICLGNNTSVQQAQNQKRVFLYKVRAPSSFANLGDEVDEDADTDTEIGMDQYFLPLVVWLPFLVHWVQNSRPLPQDIQNLSFVLIPQTQR